MKRPVAAAVLLVLVVLLYYARRPGWTADRSACVLLVDWDAMALTMPSSNEPGCVLYRVLDPSRLFEDTARATSATFAVYQGATSWSFVQERGYNLAVLSLAQYAGKHGYRQQKRKARFKCILDRVSNAFQTHLKRVAGKAFESISDRLRDAPEMRLWQCVLNPFELRL